MFTIKFDYNVIFLLNDIISFSSFVGKNKRKGGKGEGKKEE
jgi:hypothetical protein